MFAMTVNPTIDIGTSVDLLDQEGLARKVLAIRGSTRENLVVLEESSRHLFRFGIPGLELPEAEWRRYLDTVSLKDPRRIT